MAGRGTHPPVGSVRLVTADESGNEFDRVANYISGIEEIDGRQYWVGEAPVFPRRGKDLFLRLLANDGNFLAEFKIPNPASGSYPNWAAQALPVAPLMAVWR